MSAIRHPGLQLLFTGVLCRQSFMCTAVFYCFVLGNIQKHICRCVQFTHVLLQRVAMLQRQHVWNTYATAFVHRHRLPDMIYHPGCQCSPYPISFSIYNSVCRETAFVPDSSGSPAGSGAACCT